MSLKKIIILFLLLFLFPSVIFGTEIDWPSAPITGVSLHDKSEFHEFIAYAYGWGIQLGVLIFFTMIVVSGIQYIVSSGNPTQTSQAIGKIRNALLGLVLLLTSWLILNTINPRITKLTVLPSLWDEQFLEEGVILTSDQLNEPPCAFLLLYNETDYAGPGVEVPPGEYKESPKFKSGKSFRKMTEEEKKLIEEMEKAGITNTREIRGEFIEGNSCFLTFYKSGDGLFPSPCGKATGTIAGFPIQNFDKFIYEEDIKCYKIESISKKESSE
jgi:hypothetical protein